MAKKHGTALPIVASLVEVPEFAEFAGAVVAALPRKLDSATVQRLMRKSVLRQVLREALVPSNPKPTETPAVPPNWYTQLFGLVVVGGRFTGFCNTDVTGEHFPYVPGDLDDDVREVEVAIDRDMSTSDVRAQIDAQGLQGASGFRVIRWWLRHPERHNNCLVVGLGQEWDGSVVFVFGNGGSRGLDLDRVAGGWGRGCTFLAVPKVS